MAIKSWSGFALKPSWNKLYGCSCPTVQRMLSIYQIWIEVSRGHVIHKTLLQTAVPRAEIIWSPRGQLRMHPRRSLEHKVQFQLYPVCHGKLPFVLGEVLLILKNDDLFSCGVYYYKLLLPLVRGWFWLVNFVTSCYISRKNQLCIYLLSTFFLLSS